MGRRRLGASSSRSNINQLKPIKSKRRFSMLNTSNKSSLNRHKVPPIVKKKYGRLKPVNSKRKRSILNRPKLPSIIRNLLNEQ